ncbi:alpha-galactosidase [Acidaminobacter sp. JC074]|uniref:glycoside hydrolase family 36 protein n=1 Tax=Acidaminobacter sp. JC074 TaxID=2530199 RepID=UPI001F0E9F2C|nr:glycoside hydrolase family 36 protein [Acidaminobacter sp. JC074]MCH4890698.1 alpha-galactosidase [Acidaminobacter sp. JC074]
MRGLAEWMALEHLEFEIKINGQRYHSNQCESLNKENKIIYIYEGIFTLTYQYDDVLTCSLKNISNHGFDISYFELFSLDYEDNMDTSEWWIYKNGLLKNDWASVYPIKNIRSYANELQTSVTETGENEVISDELMITSPMVTLIYDGNDSYLIGQKRPDSGFINHIFSLDERLKKYSVVGDLRYLEADDVYDESFILLKGDTNQVLKDYGRLTKVDQKLSVDLPKTGWCSWYYFYENISEDHVLRQLEVIDKYQLNLDMILIDMGWEERLGTWQSNHKFSHGMKWLADKIRSKGIRPGLWLSPFWVEARSYVHLNHPEWLLKDQEGNLIVFHCHIDGFIIDTTHPKALDWMKKELVRVRYDWGYEILKLDFLRIVSLYDYAVFYREVSAFEALNDAMKAIREAVGDDTVIIACGGHYAATYDVADINRTSGDIGASWESLKRTFKRNLLRLWMNGTWWLNDPDSIVIRDKTEGISGRTAGAKDHPIGNFNARQVDTIINLYRILDGFTTLGDDLSKLSDIKLRKLNQMLNHKKTYSSFKIIDLYDNHFPSLFLMEYEKHFELLAVNWHDYDIEVKNSFGKNYELTDLINQTVETETNEIAISLLAYESKVYKYPKCY